MYKTRHDDLPKEIMGMIYNSPIDIYRYDENGDHDFFSKTKIPEKWIVAEEHKGISNTTYLVACDKNKSLYNPSIKKYDKIYHLNMLDKSKEKVFKLSKCHRDVFVLYIQYLQTKQRRFLIAAESKLRG